MSHLVSGNDDGFWFALCPVTLYTIKTARDLWLNTAYKEECQLCILFTARCLQKDSQYMLHNTEKTRTDAQNYYIIIL